MKFTLFTFKTVDILKIKIVQVNKQFTIFIMSYYNI